MQQTPVTIDLLAPLPPGTPLEVLLVREEALTNLLANQQGERNAYSRQARSGNAELRNVAQRQVTQLDIQITRTQTAQRLVRTQIASRIPERVVRNNSVYPSMQDRGSQGITGDHVAAIMIVFTLAVLMPIAIGLTRRLWRRGANTPAPQPDVVSPRLDRLEQSVDAIAIEIERVAEGQRFVTKVMSERPATPRSASSVHAGGESAALNDAKPFLALGAGPAEPIPVAQRQAVRPSITPH